MIFFQIILHPAAVIYDFHIFITSSSSFHGVITNQFSNLLSVGLLAQLVARALHQYGRGQGFESHTSLLFFRLSFRTGKVAPITEMIFFHIIKYTIKDGKLPLITALGLYIFIRGFRRAYIWRGLCPKRLITWKNKTLRNKLYGSADQTTFSIYWFLINCQSVIFTLNSF